MFKKLLLIAAIVSTATISLADDTIVPAANNETIQANSTTIIDNNGDRGYTFSPKQAIVTDIIEPFYVTYRIGYSDIDYQAATLGVPSTNQPDNSQYGLGLNLGYQFNPFLAVEAGYIYFFNKFQQQANLIQTSLTQNQTNMITLDGKLIWPIGLIMYPLKNLYIYGKAGGAYVWSSLSLENPLGSASQVQSQLRPLYGAGLSYHFTSHFMLDADWTHIVGSNTAPSLNAINCLANFATPVVDFYSLGFTYSFDFGKGSQASTFEDKPLS